MTQEIVDLFAAARERLGEAPREALGELRTARRIFGITRAPRIVPVGEAWHLGVLLLADERIAATGRIVRAREEVRRGFTAESQRDRAALAAAARRGGFAEGQSVHVDWQAIDLTAVGEATTPLALSDGRPAVRWSPTGGLVPLARYLDERIDLLRHPPERA